jgi:predicted extracellular nuclease
MSVPVKDMAKFPSVPKIQKRRFKVGTFNLYNLVLPNVVYYEKNEYSPEIYQRKTDWISHQLNSMDADIVGFQELFHEAALRDVLAKTQQYEDAHLVTANPTGEKPVVALLSKFPILSHQIYEQFPSHAQLDIEGVVIPLNEFSRPVLAVNLALTDSLECTVFVAHLKSKRPIFPEGSDRSDPVERAKGQARALIRRAAEATALRSILMETLQHASRPVILLGDMNDSGQAVTNQILSGELPFETLKLEQKKEIWDVILYSVKDIQSRQSHGDFYYTYIHDGHYESLDHIFVSQELVAQNPDRVGRVTSVSVFNDHLIDEIFSEEEVEQWQSDHGQVVASFRLENRE